jgi:hypothetical protein
MATNKGPSWDAKLHYFDVTLSQLLPSEWEFNYLSKVLTDYFKNIIGGESYRKYAELCQSILDETYEIADSNLHWWHSDEEFKKATLEVRDNVCSAQYIKDFRIVFCFIIFYQFGNQITTKEISDVLHEICDYYIEDEELKAEFPRTFYYSNVFDKVCYRNRMGRMRGVNLKEFQYYYNNGEYPKDYLGDKFVRFTFGALSHSRISLIQDIRQKFFNGCREKYLYLLYLHERDYLMNMPISEGSLNQYRYYNAYTKAGKKTIGDIFEVYEKREYVKGLSDFKELKYAPFYLVDALVEAGLICYDETNNQLI